MSDPHSFYPVVTVQPVLFKFLIAPACSYKQSHYLFFPPLAKYATTTLHHPSLFANHTLCHSFAYVAMIKFLDEGNKLQKID